MLYGIFKEQCSGSPGEGKGVCYLVVIMAYNLFLDFYSSGMYFAVLWFACRTDVAVKHIVPVGP